MYFSWSVGGIRGSAGDPISPNLKVTVVPQKLPPFPVPALVGLFLFGD